MSKIDLSTILRIADAARLTPNGSSSLVTTTGKHAMPKFDESHPEEWANWKELFVRFAHLQKWSPVTTLEWIPFYLTGRIQRIATNLIRDLTRVLYERARSGEQIVIPTVEQVLSTLDAKVHGPNYLRTAILDYSGMTSRNLESFRNFYDRVEQKRNEIDGLPGRVGLDPAYKDSEMVDILVRGAPLGLRQVWVVKRPRTVMEARAEGEDWDANFGISDATLSALSIKNPDRLRLLNNQVITTSKVLKGDRARDLLKKQKSGDMILFTDEDDEDEEAENEGDDSDAGSERSKKRHKKTKTTPAITSSTASSIRDLPPAVQQPPQRQAAKNAGKRGMSGSSSSMTEFMPFMQNMLMAQMHMINNMASKNGAQPVPVQSKFFGRAGQDSALNQRPVPQQGVPMLGYTPSTPQMPPPQRGTARQARTFNSNMPVQPSRSGGVIRAPEDNVCGNCGKLGHYARDCLEPCRLCGDSTHTSRTCPTSPYNPNNRNRFQNQTPQ